MESIKAQKARCAKIVRASPIAELSSGPIVLSKAVLTAVLAELEGILEKNLSKLNMDPSLVAKILSSVYERTKPMRPQLARLYDFDLSSFDKSEDYAGVLLWATDRHEEALSSPDDRTLRDEAELFCHRLQTEVKCLVVRGVIDKITGKKLLRRPSATNMALSLAMLAAVITQLWPSIQGKTFVTEKELARAGQVAQELMQAGRAQSEAQRKTALTRQRAYTKCVQVYNELRCALVYIRRAQGDADLIAPSLFMLRHQRNVPAEVRLE